MEQIKQQLHIFQVTLRLLISNLIPERSCLMIKVVLCWYYYIGIFVIRSGGRSLVSPLTAPRLQDKSGANKAYKRRLAEDNIGLIEHSNFEHYLSYVI